MTSATRFVLLATIATIATLGVVACQKRSAANQTTADSAAAQAVAAAPDSFRVAFETGKGRFVVQATRNWAPRGVDQFHQLVEQGFYDRVKFFRVLPNFIAQFGINGDPEINKQGERAIPDDPVTQSNRKGTLTFATGGPNTRTTQLFINTRDNRQLDAMGFAPIGHVVEGMEVVEKLYSRYGEGAPDGRGPMQGRIEREGNAYLNRYFPRLDSIITARVVKD
ncbi:MAG: peptidylprolyl isomerase [Gemmatimonadaceae bacterium]